MPVKHINSDYSFDAEMNKAGSRPVCVDFFAEWCGPCKHIAPFFEQLSNKYPSVVFLKVDVDQCTNASASNGVQAMPTFMMFINKTKKDTVRGADSSSLESMVRKYANAGGAAASSFGGRGATLAGGVAGGSSSSSSGSGSMRPMRAVHNRDPSMWARINARLASMGVPQLGAHGFVFEPAVVMFAIGVLLLYGPLAGMCVFAIVAFAQTSASPFDRYVPAAPAPAGRGAPPTAPRAPRAAPAATADATASAASAAAPTSSRAADADALPSPPTKAFGGAGRRLGD